MKNNRGFVIESTFAIVTLIALATLAIVKLTPVGALTGLDSGQGGGAEDDADEELPGDDGALHRERPGG